MTHIADRAASIPSFDVAGVDDVMLRRRLEAAYQSLADALDGGVPISISDFESELDLLARDAVRSVALGHPMYATLETWREIARGRFAAASVGSARTSIADAPPSAPPSLAARMSFFAQNSSSFRFAASLMPESDQLRLAGVYAWCRFTDDLVDHATDDDGADIETRLDEWLAASRAAYDGEATGIALLDDVMACTRDSGVPFDYAAELIAGMRMDLRHRDFADDAELSLYTWRAAGTVGRWLAEMHDVRDAWSLERAAVLGQAMQLTNIVRDVGEDLGRGRLYIPHERLRAHGLSREILESSLKTGRLPGRGWRELLEGMMTDVDRQYELAAEAFVMLPNSFRRAAAAAAAVYRGIHDAIRRNNYDVLHRRAVTTPTEKVSLVANA